MVQLKGHTRFRSMCLLLQISIPYGSIKSTSIVFLFIDIDGFQFLMVQLKACFVINSSILLINFNSLWFN